MMSFNKRDTIDEDEDGENNDQINSNLDERFSKRNTYQEGIKFLR